MIPSATINILSRLTIIKIPNGAWAPTYGEACSPIQKNYHGSPTESNLSERSTSFCPDSSMPCGTCSSCTRSTNSNRKSPRRALKCPQAQAVSSPFPNRDKGLKPHSAVDSRIEMLNGATENDKKDRRRYSKNRSNSPSRNTKIFCRHMTSSRKSSLALGHGSRVSSSNSTVCQHGAIRQ
jgi:hypothetical protein